MAKFTYDQHFRNFASSLQSVILGYGGSPEDDFTKKQKAQVEKLVKAEKKFKKILQHDSRGHLVYKAFINFIMDDKRNILAARPYFRERQGVFSSGISPSIKSRKYKRLHRFDVNFPFIAFALNAFPWGPNSKIRNAAKEVYAIRREIIELNMPLAISRARIFRQKTPESHLTYMDLVQISMEGLINAVDKFVLPYTPVFRSVIIGRIVGDLIENYSDTMLHFYPSDRRKIYRANKAQKNKAVVSFDDLSDAVNGGIPLDNPTNSSEIQHLITASSHFSLDSPAPDSDEGEGESLADKYSANEDVRPDVRVEKSQLYSQLYEATKDLNILETKFLKMRGIEI